VGISDDIRVAAQRVIDAFGRFDQETYFGCFDPDAIVSFYYEPKVLTLVEYRAIWRDWEQSGFRVLTCESSNQLIVEVADNVGLLVHDVRTEVVERGENKTLNERESILLRKRDRDWLVIHEHLSRPEALPS
jgi:ketosteroid isomerase-like protein